MSDSLPGVWFHDRIAVRDAPAGITVSRNKKLPDGDFGLTEYHWGPVSLWFVDDDEFSADERQDAYRSYVMGQLSGRRARLDRTGRGGLTAKESGYE